MIIFQRLFTVLLFCLVSFSASAVQIEFHSFNDLAKEKLYLELIAELRCVKCQNQNLAESNAEIARDMRTKTYEMVVSGKSRKDVVTYMTARYGDFVLYKPPFKAKTLLLWIGPPVLLLSALLILFRRIRKQPLDTERLSEQERESVQNILIPNTIKSNNGK